MTGRPTPSRSIRSAAHWFSQRRSASPRSSTPAKQEQRAEERRKRQEQLEADAERIRILEEQQPKREPTPGLDPFMALHQEVR